MSANDFISELAAQGRYHFCTDEIRDALNSSKVAARAALRRLRNKGRIATPQRGFHLVLPPEYQRLGCLPPDQFIPQLMERLGQPYYTALLSASRYHGASHQQPQIFQVIVPQYRPTITCGKIRVRFIARHNAADMPAISINTPRGHAKVSSPETTAYDLVGYFDHAGGMDNVASILVALSAVLQSQKLASLAPLSPIPWAQRLGYLLDRVGAKDLAEPLATYIKDHAKETALLVPAVDATNASRTSRWKLLINVQVEPDL